MKELDIQEQTKVIPFAKWLGESYFYEHGKWCSLYNDKRLHANWKSTEYLYDHWFKKVYLTVLV